MTTINAEFWQMALAKSELRVANVLRRNQSKAKADENRARAAYNRSITGKPARVWHDDVIPVRIGRIPASVWLTYYDPGRPARTWGRPEDSYPAEGPEVEYVVCDRDGYEAGDWLLSMVDREELDRQVLEILERTS